MNNRILLAAAAAVWASCGGNGSTTLAPSSTLAARCASPRTGIDPTTNAAYTDKQGTAVDEKKWLRSWTDELYLWYREVPNADPAGPQTVSSYFDLMRTTAKTASGKDKDQFHFTYPTADWIALSQSGVQAGYGVQWVVLAGLPPRKVVVGYNEPGSPAAKASPAVARGAEVRKVDGFDLVNGADANPLNAGLFPSAAGESHTFEILDVGAASTRTVTLISGNVQSTPVQNVGPIPTATSVGYMLFNDHIATAEDELLAAINQLKSAGVTDLVIDIRYNGGGYLAIASELAYMIAGPGPTAGKTFERFAFNDRYLPTQNPVTGRSLVPTPFYATSVGFGTTPPGQALPHLDLNRVFLLTGPGTCSASESIINGLQGVNVTVVQIGSTTCGKPYGFYPWDNCGTTYFSIQFQGVNQKGFGDYADGFTPGATGASGVPGCKVADDFTHALGDPAEARLAAALGYRTTQTCPPATSVAGRTQAMRSLAAVDGQVVKSPWLQNRIVLR